MIDYNDTDAIIDLLQYSYDKNAMTDIECQVH